MKFKLVLVLLLLATPFQVHSSLKFNNYNISKGLANNTVWSIAKGADGFMWIGTSNGISRFDGYQFKNYYLDSPYSKSLALDQSGRLWVGTDDSKLFYLEKHSFHSASLNDNSSIKAIKSDSNGVWVLTKQGLHFKGYNLDSFSKIIDLKSQNLPFQTINSISVTNSNLVYLNTNNGIYRKETHNNIIKVELPKHISTNILFLTLIADDEWFIASDKSAFFYSPKSKKITKIINALDGIVIRTLHHSNDIIWIGTLSNGLFKLSNYTITQYKSSKKKIGSLSENTINSIYVDNNILWVGTFFKGIDRTPLSNSYISSVSNPIMKSCDISNKVYSFFQADSKLYFSIPDYLIEYNFKSQVCNYHLLPKITSSFNQTIYQVLIDSSNDFWVASSQGLFKFIEGQLILEKLPLSELIIFSMIEVEGSKLLLGTNKGLFIYDLSDKKLKQLTELDSAIIHNIKEKDGISFALSNKGLFKINNNLEVIPFTLDKSLFEKEVNALLLNNDSLIIGAADGYIYEYNYFGEFIRKHRISEHPKTLMPISLAKGIDNNSIWFSTYDGLFSINLKQRKQKRYTVNDGLTSNFHIRNSSYQNKEGALFFGNESGFNAFYPEDIKDEIAAPKVVLTKLTRFNKEVIPGESDNAFIINEPIENLSELEIGHRDYIIGFEFSGLHFADPMRNQYQYKLEGFHKDWIKADASNRTATFTNLPPGKYTLKIKASNKDGFWSHPQESIALSIKVHPAPWLSWWAFTIYGLLVFISIIWIIKLRTNAAIARANKLESEVSLRTKEIETQKNVIESLLERKNELFANISHEFRTPLTLILGPLAKELENLDRPKNSKNLQMIQRNANRLLGMVEQILKLTELRKGVIINKLPHAINPILEAVTDSFQSLSESKQIALSLHLDSDVNIFALHDSLEVMVGNLLSNAIKYTPEGGKVTVQSKVSNKTVQIIVTDTGVGMTKVQQNDVFERFVRLDKTSDISGIGIGLSIVKELALANKGKVKLKSTEDKGSTFIINLPITNQAALADTLSVKSIEHLIRQESNINKETQTKTNISLNQSELQKEIILIIDDNPDMISYIQETLKPSYHCLTANRGEAGFELAKTQVPDLVICDIMMPGIDGYEVARLLRNDIITSHIPLVLLTAKGDECSRIKGWNENIDDYMTKPFNENELRARVNNIIALRSLIKASMTKQTKRRENQLTDKDKAFIQKLNSILEQHYQDPLCNRSIIAKNMAVSERQLQRKLKGLINQNPMDYLRNYRLEKGAKLISTGKPINLISDLCGFNSASHFTQCFKAKFGVTPKKYL